MPAEGVDRHHQVVVTAAIQKSVARAYARRGRRRLWTTLALVSGFVCFLGWKDGNLVPSFATIALLLPFALVTARRANARAAARAYPLGQPAASTFGSADLTLVTSRNRVSLPYRDLLIPVVEDGVVVFSRRSTKRAALIVPAALCPHALLEQVRAGKDDAVGVRDPDPALFQQRFTAEADTADRLGSAVFWGARRTPLGICVALLPVTVGLLLLPVGSPITSAGVAVLTVPWNLYQLFVMRLTMRRQFSRGTLVAFGLTDDGYALYAGGTSAELRFADFDRSWVNDDAVVLRQRAQKACFNVIPRRVLDDGEVDRIRSSVG